MNQQHPCLAEAKLPMGHDGSRQRRASAEEAAEKHQILCQLTKLAVGTLPGNFGREGY
jgi:hypothetical protein